MLRTLIATDDARRFVRRASYVDEVKNASFLVPGTLYEELSTRTEYYGLRMAENQQRPYGELGKSGRFDAVVDTLADVRV